MWSRFRTCGSPLLGRFECLPTQFHDPLSLYPSRFTPYQMCVPLRRCRWDSNVRIRQGIGFGCVRCLLWALHYATMEGVKVSTTSVEDS